MLAQTTPPTPIKVEVTLEEILADLLFPAPVRPPAEAGEDQPR